MADTMRKKVSKLHDSRAKAEAELNKIQQKLNDAIGNAERRVHVDRIITSCEEAMTKAFAKNEQLLDLAKKSTNPESVKPDLEKMLNDVAVRNDEILRKARDYLEKCLQTGNASQTSIVPSTKKTKSRKFQALFYQRRQVNGRKSYSLQNKGVKKERSKMKLHSD